MTKLKLRLVLDRMEGLKLRQAGGAATRRRGGVAPATLGWGEGEGGVTGLPNAPQRLVRGGGGEFWGLWR